jgi:hypothetical protein
MLIEIVIKRLFVTDKTIIEETFNINDKEKINLESYIKSFILQSKNIIG